LVIPGRNYAPTTRAQNENLENGVNPLIELSKALGAIKPGLPERNAFHNERLAVDGGNAANIATCGHMWPVYKFKCYLVVSPNITQLLLSGSLK